MNGEPRAGRGVDAVCGAMALALLALLLGFSAWLWRAQHQPLLLVPAIGGLGGVDGLVAFPVLGRFT